MAAAPFGRKRRGYTMAEAAKLALALRDAPAAATSIVGRVKASRPSYADIVADRRAIAAVLSLYPDRVPTG